MDPSEIHSKPRDLFREWKLLAVGEEEEGELGPEKLLQSLGAHLSKAWATFTKVIVHSTGIGAGPQPMTPVGAPSRAFGGAASEGGGSAPKSPASVVPPLWGPGSSSHSALGLGAPMGSLSAPTSALGHVPGHVPAPLARPWSAGPGVGPDGGHTVVMDGYGRPRLVPLVGSATNTNTTSSKSSGSAGTAQGPAKRPPPLLV